MKTLILIFIAFSFSALGQDTIRSQKLDSLIWKKINEYRTSINRKPCTTFESSYLREFSRLVTERNSVMKTGVHSDEFPMDNGGECLFQSIIKGTCSPDVKKQINLILDGNLEELAEMAVQNWIDSPTHRAIISNPTWTVSTITSKIVIVDSGKTQYIRFDTTYICEKEIEYIAKKRKN